MKGQRVVVWGMGRHGGGLATALYAQSQGAKVEVLELSPPEKLPEAAAAAQQHSWFWHQGDGTHPCLKTADCIIASPAIPPTAWNVDVFQKKNVTSPELLFFAAHSGPRIAITGTKGKSTTANLTAQLLGWNAIGNSNEPVLSHLLRRGPDAPVVIELSSFQLWYLARNPPRIDLAIMPSLDIDHLNWHPDARHYQGCKLAMLDWAKEVLLPKELAGRIHRPSIPGCSWDAQGFHDANGHFLCALDNLGLLGDHNRDNACLALSAALRFGLSIQEIPSRLSTISALPHRLQTVVKCQGITCIDDSIATTPPSAIAALQSISGPLSIILGGSDKGADFGALAQAVKTRGAQVVLIGQVKPRLMQALEAIGYSYHSAENMIQAVETCKMLLPGTGTILLSPACASFGMFTCFEERGDCFSAACKQLFRG